MGRKKDTAVQSVLPTQEDWYEILTVEVQKRIPTRVIVSVLICVAWAGTYFIARYVGDERMSLAVALKFGLLPSGILFSGYFFLGYLSYRGINPALLSEYPESEIENYLEEEDRILDFAALERFTAGGFSFLGARYANAKYRKSGQKKREAHQATLVLFFAFILIIFHWWAIYMAPRTVSEIIYQFKFRSASHAFFRVMKAFLPWLVLTYLSVVFLAAHYGAQAIDLTK